MVTLQIKQVGTREVDCEIFLLEHNKKIVIFKDGNVMIFKEKVN